MAGHLRILVKVRRSERRLASFRILLQAQECLEALLSQ